METDKECWIQILKRLKKSPTESRKSMEWFKEEIRKNNLRANKDFLLEALKIDRFTLDFASEEIRGDKDFLLEVVKFDGTVLGSAVPSLRNDREFVKAAVEINGLSLQYASKELKGDEEIVLAAVNGKGSGSVVMYASGKLRMKKDFAMKVVKIDGSAFKFFDDILKDDIELFLEAYESNRVAVLDVGPQIKQNYSPLISTLQLHKGQLERMLETFDIEQLEGEKGKFGKELIRRYFKRKRPAELHFKYFKNEQNKRVFEVEKQHVDVMKKRLEGVGLKNLIFHRELGSGAYGITYLCRVKSNAELIKGMFVVKLYKHISVSEEEFHAFKDSIFIPYHENVVSVLSRFSNSSVKKGEDQVLPDYEEKKQPYQSVSFARCGIIMKYHWNDLRGYLNNDYFKQGTNFGFSGFRLIFRGLIRGVAHLNRHRIIHRDIHSGNIFLDPEYGRVWIGDFGCALDLRTKPKLTKETPEEDEGEKDLEWFKVRKDDPRLKGYVSRSSMAILEKGGYSKGLAPEIRDFDLEKDEFIDYGKCDVFSVGKIGEKLLQYIPSWERQQPPKNQKTTIIKRKMEEISNMEELVRKMVELEYGERFTIEQALDGVGKIFPRGRNEQGLHAFHCSREREYRLTSPQFTEKENSFSVISVSKSMKYRKASSRRTNKFKTDWTEKEIHTNVLDEESDDKLRRMEKIISEKDLEIKELKKKIEELTKKNQVLIHEKTLCTCKKREGNL